MLQWYLRAWDEKVAYYKAGLEAAYKDSKEKRAGHWEIKVYIHKIELQLKASEEKIIRLKVMMEQEGF